MMPRPSPRTPRRLPALLLAAALLSSSTSQGHEDLESRIPELDARIAAEPVSAALHLERGELHRLHRDWAAALADYERARALDPELALVDLCLGRMKLESGRPAEAEEALARYVARRPGDLRGVVLRGRVRIALGDFAPGVADLSLAIAVRGRDAGPELYLERSRALRAAGGPHLEQALRGLEEGLEQLGRPVTLELLALELEQSLGRTEAALARLDRLAAASDRPGPWLLREGELLESAGLYGEARLSYQAARVALRGLPEHDQRRGGTADLARRIEAALARSPAAAGEGGVVD